jgi:hypothetical protein
MNNNIDVWEQHSPLFLLGLVFAPSWTLLFASNIKLAHPLMWLCVFYAPDYSMIVIAFYRGYYSTNWFLLLCVVYSIVYKDLSRFLRERQMNHQLRNQVNLTFNIPSHHPRGGVISDDVYNVVTILATIAPPLNSAVAKVLQDKLDIILDVSKSKIMNNMQLSELRNELSDSLDAINHELEKRPKIGDNDTQENIINHGSCVICMDNSPVIVSNPCRHNQFCDNCFETVQNCDDNSTFATCCICRTPVISWDTIYNSKVSRNQNVYVMNRINSENFHASGTLNAQGEVSKLIQHVNSHPELLSKLSNKGLMESYGVHS